MIGGGESLRAARVALVDAHAAVGQGAQAGVEAVLADLAARMVPATPVRSGRMKARYHVLVSGLFGELLDDQFYAGWVARTGTRYMRPNPALLGILTDADDHAGDTIDAMIAARLASGLRP